MTLGGTHFLNNSKGCGDAVNLLLTKQFADIVENSKCDYVIFSTIQDNVCCVFDKIIINAELKNKLIDLKKFEFFVFPAMPQFTTVKRTKLN